MYNMTAHVAFLLVAVAEGFIALVRRKCIMVAKSA